MATDPVCGNTLHPKTADWLISYKGRFFYFCSPTCKQRFDVDPDLFAGDTIPDELSETVVAEREAVVEKRVLVGAVAHR